MECIFCSIVAGGTAFVVDADEHAVAFLDIHPMQRGHTLVVPRRHVADLTSDPDALAEVAPLAARVAARLRQALGADGLNLFSSAGAVAGQEVFHLHLHLVPRYADRPGLRALFGEPGETSMEELAELHRQLTR